MYPETDKIRRLVGSAASIVVVQADNPDADSMASALALEQILGDEGKEVYLYCGIDIPSYLHHLQGWSRIEKDLPKKFDASIIVDTSSDVLLEQLEKSGQKMWLKSKPVIIIDHHKTEASINYASVVCNQPAVATAEIIYDIASELKWNLNQTAKELIAVAILSDSLGLMSEATSAKSIRIIADLVEGGVKLAELEDARREMLRRDPELVHYKGQLLERVEFYNDNQVAVVTIPPEEIERYSPLYNPSMLVLDDMRLARGTDVAIAFKRYRDGKVTGKIRCNYGRGMADKLSEHFGGGGHPYAAGFKITSGKSYEQIKSECIKVAGELLAQMDEKK